jgi:hypothetical protein
MFTVKGENHFLMRLAYLTYMNRKHIRTSRQGPDLKVMNDILPFHLMVYKVTSRKYLPRVLQGFPKVTQCRKIIARSLISKATCVPSFPTLCN